MKYIYCIISILCTLPVQIKAQCERSINQFDSLYVQFMGEVSDSFEFNIVNKTQDTLYLFDSYLEKNLYNSKYLHRFDRKNKQCKLSLLPLLPFLSVEYTDVVLLGDNRVINKGQVLYHFKIIMPNSVNKIKINKSAFYVKDYVNDICTKKISKFDKIKFHKSSINRCSNVIVEFAIYKDIDLLTSFRSYYFDEFNFNKQGLSYSVLSVSVNL